MKNNIGLSVTLLVFSIVILAIFLSLYFEIRTDPPCQDEEYCNTTNKTFIIKLCDPF